MSTRRSEPILAFLVVTLLLALLAVLATLQYRWIGQLSAAEQDRMRRSLESSTQRFVDDFDREISSAFFRFHHPSGASLVQTEKVLATHYEAWRESAAYPELIEELLVVSRRDPGVLELRRLDPMTRSFDPLDWPPELELFRERLSSSGSLSPGPRGGSRGGGRRPVLLPGTAPILVVPMRSLQELGLEVAERFAPQASYALVRLDLRYLKEVCLPELAERHFGGPRGLEYELAVVAPEDPQLLYRSDPGLSLEHFGAADTMIDFFTIRPFPDFRLWGSGATGFPTWGRGGGVSPPRREMAAGPRSPTRRDRSLSGRSARRPRRPLFPAPGPYWRLLVVHRSGSLEAAVAVARVRNLSLSLGILLILGGTVVALLVATQRARRLARQQLEFVAGVTHELHTPLAAIRAAGENLADGVVQGEEQVKRYGGLIEKEGHRLTEMVRQALEFAGIQSGQRRYEMRPAKLDQILQEALEDCRAVVEERSLDTRVEIAAGLPAVQADPSALRQAFHNLIGNAAKYAPPHSVIGVRAACGGDRKSREITVRIADSGPGIPKEELSHLFEPFYRGRAAAAGSVPGNGMGLAVTRHVVESHGGRLSVDSKPRQGSVFTVRLPVAEPVDDAVDPSGGLEG